jgi:hypothetical protein
MNCSEFESWLQRCLDDRAIGDPVDFQGHLARCPGCRGTLASARRLESGLRLLVSPAPPRSLTGRVAARVISEQEARARRSRRFFAVAAVAAGLIVAAFLGNAWRSSQIDRPQVVEPPVAHHSLPAVKPAASLRHQMREAGSALVALVGRTADEAVEPTRALLPAAAPATSLLGPSTWAGPLEPPVQSLRHAGAGVSMGLEPVVSSARRAVDLFLQAGPATANATSGNVKPDPSR